MKQIQIRYDKDIPDDKAMMYAAAALKGEEQRTGIVTFKDGTVLWFSDRAKNIAITITKE